MGLFGTFNTVANGPASALVSSPSLQGIGMTMEALSNNYVMYDLVTGTSRWSAWACRHKILTLLHRQHYAQSLTDLQI